MKIPVLVFLFFLIVVLIYSTLVVINARHITQGKVESYYNNGKIELKLSDLTEKQIEILITVQDPNFYNHNGVEFTTPGSGWTTITQSLAKKFYFKNFKQGIRKVKQTLCARYALDSLVDKETQLELFINLMYYGNNYTGIKEAASGYFNKDINELSEDEFISLIGSLVAPVNLNIKDNPIKNQERVDRIKKVLSKEYIPKGLFDIMYDKE